MDIQDLYHLIHDHSPGMTHPHAVFVKDDCKMEFYQVTDGGFYYCIEANACECGCTLKADNVWDASKMCTCSNCKPFFTIGSKGFGDSYLKYFLKGNWDFVGWNHVDYAADKKSFIKYNQDNIFL